MLGFVVGTLAALVLFLAGAWKLAAPADIRHTLEALGVGAPEKLAVVVAVAELATGSALILAPDIVLTTAAIATLGIAFAAAGVVAIVRKIRVHCACLGPALAGQLGSRQVLLVPGWFIVAAAGYLEPSPLSLDERLQLLVVVLVVLALGALIRLAPLAQEHRTLRRLLGEH